MKEIFFALLISLVSYILGHDMTNSSIIFVSSFIFFFLFDKGSSDIDFLDWSKIDKDIIDKVKDNKYFEIFNTIPVPVLTVNKKFDIIEINEVGKQYLKSDYVKDGNKLTSYIKESELNEIFDDITDPDNIYRQTVNISSFQGDNRYVVFLINTNDMFTFVVSLKDITDIVEKENGIEVQKLILDLHNTDLEEKISKTSRELKESYLYDSSTNIGNRSKLLMDIIDYRHPIILIITLKDFHWIYEYFGYEKGQRVLLDFYDIMRDVVPCTATIYHTSEYTFSILDEVSNNNIQHMVIVFDNIERNIINSNIKIDEDNFEILPNIIGAISNDLNHTLSKASMLLYESVSSNNRLTVDDDMNVDNINHKREMLDLLSSAFKNDLIVPHFQPIIDTATKELYKYEALARIDTNGTVFTPDKFMGVAKQTFMYFNITETIIKKTAEVFKDSDTSFSINIEKEDLMSGRTMDFIYETFYEYPNPERVTFELVETELIDSDNVLSGSISRLKGLGCKIAIDDFGSGYSNFEYLLRIDADYLKIDGSLIKDLDTSEEARVIVKSIVDFCKYSGMKTIAEFVSSENIYNEVKKIGINYCQGWYFGKPESLSKEVV